MLCMTSQLILTLAAGLCFCAAPTLSCGEDGKASDPDLPQPLDTSSITSVVHQSPFNRVVSFEGTYSLTGVAWVDGKPLATILNTETKKRFVVSTEPNAEGWRLASANLTTDPKYSSVKLIVGGEEVSLRYTMPAVPEKSQSSRSFGGGRVIEPVDIHNLKEEDYIRKDENGKPYVRGSIYLPQADREYYYNGMPQEARDKFRQLTRDHRDTMFRMSPDQRATFSKRAFDAAMQGVRR